MRDLLVGCWFALMTSRPVLWAYNWVHPYPSTRRILAAIEMQARVLRVAYGPVDTPQEQCPKPVGPVE